MMPLARASVPPAALPPLTWIGVQLWMTVTRQRRQPDYAEAHAYYRARAAPTIADHPRG
jgi:hypothetical protein